MWWCLPEITEVEAGGLVLQGSLACMRPCLKQNNPPPTKDNNKTKNVTKNPEKEQRNSQSFTEEEQHVSPVTHVRLFSV